MPRLLVRTAVALVGLMTAGASARAASTDFEGTRALGMGGALRGAATGDAGIMLNPSGMSLLRSYAVEAGYRNATSDNAHAGHASLVDSTSGLNIAAGVAYTYVNTSPAGGGGVSGHRGAFALSLPFGESFYLGAALRYARLTTEALDVALPAAKTTGFTFDIGATLRPLSTVTIGLVGTGLNDLKSPLVPVTVGGGVSAAPLPNLIAAFDAVLTFTTWDKSRGDVWSLMGGAEYMFAKKFAVRAGGGRNGVTSNGSLSGGFSALSDAGALDFAIARDISGARPSTYVGVSLRLFVPTP